jgi:hypothetical protein
MASGRPPVVEGDRRLSDLLDDIQQQLFDPPVGASAMSSAFEPNARATFAN